MLCSTFQIIQSFHGWNNKAFMHIKIGKYLSKPLLYPKGEREGTSGLVNVSWYDFSGLEIKLQKHLEAVMLIIVNPHNSNIFACSIS